MTITEIGQLLANIIQAYMALGDDRVVLKDEGFDAPKDDGIYVLILHETGKTMSIKSSIDSSTQIETMSRSGFESFSVEVVSRNRDADDRYPEVLMGLQSVQGQQAQESAQVSIFRGGQELDLSSVEGSGALRRWHIPIIVSNVQSKTAAVPYFDKFRDLTVKVEAQ
jgi:hypothetical protein